MDFVFMLTRSDQTATDCLEVLDDIRALGLAHIGFKDVGVSPDVLAELACQIKAAGATSYMEVVSTSREACLRSARVARDIGIDRAARRDAGRGGPCDPRRQRSSLPAVPRSAVRASDQARGLGRPG